MNHNYINGPSRVCADYSDVTFIQTRRKGGAARVLALEKGKPVSAGVAAADAAAKEAAAAKEELKRKTLKQVSCRVHR